MQILFLLNFACTVPSPSYSGHGTYSYMAFDGERSWQYQNESEDYSLIVEKTDYDLTDGVETITFEYSKKDPQEYLGSITWSAGTAEGIGIVAYATASEEIELDSMLIFAKTRMIPGDIIESTSNGNGFEASLVGVETVSNNWSAEDWETLHFEVNATTEGTGVPLIGDFWMANGWGPSRFTVSEGPWASEGDWVLSQANWE